VVFGNLNPAMPAYADAYMSAEDSVWKTSGNETCYINYTSKYYIEVSANNGRLMAYVSLKAGDILTSTVIAGGARGDVSGCTNPDYRHAFVHENGAAGCLVSLNGSPLIGAGGRTGNSAYFKSKPYTLGTVPATPVSEINNQYFSSGAGGSMNGYGGSGWGLYGFYKGSNGATINGCVAAIAPDKGSAGDYSDIAKITVAQSGSNYLDTSRATLVSAPNNGTAVSVTLKPVIVTEKQSLSGIDDGVSRIAQNLNTIAGKIGKLKSTQQTLNNTLQSTVSTIANCSGGGSVVTNVTVGESFSVYASMEISQTGTFTDSGVTCVNNDSQDGYIKLSGAITTRGSKEYLFGGTKVVINAVDVPNGSNVAVVLD
jgi:hypothetical protein